MKGHRAGYVLTEGLVTLGLSVLVGAAICSAIMTQSRLARGIAERIAHNNAMRATLHIVSSELRYVNTRTDVRAASADSVGARWFRSSGVICAQQGADIWVRGAGMRQPDMTKDSLLIIDASGERTHAALSVVPDETRCTPQAGESVLRMRVPAAPANGFVAIFESGSYYMTQRALRYRVGGEGRQPLTEEYFVDAGTAFEVESDESGGGIGVTIALKPQSHHAYGRTAAHSISPLNTFPSDSLQ